MKAIDVFNLDVMPARSGIEGEMVFEGDDLVRIRFRAVVLERRRIFRRQPEQRSAWSGWFDYENEPIALTWAAFWGDEEIAN